MPSSWSRKTTQLNHAASNTRLYNTTSYFRIDAAVVSHSLMNVVAYGLFEMVWDDEIDEIVRQAMVVECDTL